MCFAGRGERQDKTWEEELYATRSDDCDAGPREGGREGGCATGSLSVCVRECLTE